MQDTRSEFKDFIRRQTAVFVGLGGLAAVIATSELITVL